MEKAVSAADANRIIPVDENQKIEVIARGSLLTRLRCQLVTQAGRWTRDELYEDKQ
jgi:hypothetical protein